MPEPFLDTNVLLSYLLQDDPVQGGQASAIVRRIREGELSVRISDIVVFEAVFTLQRRYGLPRDAIAGAIERFLALSGVILPEKALWGRVFELYLSTSVGFADCYHAVLMQRLGLDEVLSFDRDFDRLPGIVRRES